MMEIVTITVKGSQIDIEPDPVVVVSKGTLRLEDTKYYIEYTESMDTESCNIVENVIIAQDEKVVINRTGAINTIMQFETQKKNAVEYETQFGVIAMDIITNSIRITKSEGCITIVIDYIFEMNGEHVSRNVLTIEVRR